MHWNLLFQVSLNKYASWFYHPKGTSASVQSLVPNDFSDSSVADFSDSMSDSTEEFSSDQPEPVQSDLEISEVENNEPDVNSDGSTDNVNSDDSTEELDFTAE